MGNPASTKPKAKHPMQHSTSADARLGISFAEKDLLVLWGSRLSSKSAMRPWDRGIQGCISSPSWCQRNDHSPLLNACKKHCVSFELSTRIIRKLKWIKQSVTKLSRGWSTQCMRREWGFVWSREDKEKNGSNYHLPPPNGCLQRIWSLTFLRVYSERQEATDAFFGKEITFKKKKMFSIIIVVKQSNRLSREVVEMSLEIFKLTGKYPKQPDPTFMSALLWGDGTKWPSEVSSNLNWTVIHYQFFKLFSLKSTEISSMETKLFLSNFNHLKNSLGNLKNVKLNHNVIYRAWCLLLVKLVIARNH